MTNTDDPRRGVLDYHDGTKHQFNRFARSLGYLDWASQPKPFRSYAGARQVPLFPHPDAEGLAHRPLSTYDALFHGAPRRDDSLPALGMPAVGFFLRHALGLSAWKQFGASRWSLRVNPSSGNLHPTEAYVVAGPCLWHYAPDRHVLEERCVFDEQAWRALDLDPSRAFFVGLTSIYWREAWKYGERAFRYCHHDVGHAIGALRIAAALCGWTANVVPDWPRDARASLLGLERPDDFADAEPEDPACLLLVTADAVPVGGAAAWSAGDQRAFVRAVSQGQWSGRASQLSEDHVQWTFIDDIAEVTAGVGDRLVDRHGVLTGDRDVPHTPSASAVSRLDVARRERPAAWDHDRQLDAAAVILGRRSAVSLDGLSWMERDAFVRLLARTMPGPHAPFDVLPGDPRIHLAIFAHRVRGLDPGVYLLVRCEASEALLRSALGRELAWERADGALPLWRLRTGDCRVLAQRLSCDQAIAGDGFFSLGMLAEFDGSLAVNGPAAYRRLYWEAGLVGQVLYLEAEAAGARGTGIGCFYDDAVHDVLGIRDHAIQSLYHFTVGIPVEDSRLTTERGYSWEQ